MKSNNLIDIESVCIHPTWRNCRTGSAMLARILDRFLIKESMLDKINLIRQWVGSGGISDHYPIFLDIIGLSPKPHAPFKFNLTRLGDEGYHKMVKQEWRIWSRSKHVSAVEKFMQNLHHIKRRSIDWAKIKRKRDDEALYNIEEELTRLEDPVNGGFSSLEAKQHVIQLEAEKIKLLKEKEETWRLRSRSLWSKSGDENIRFFQQFTKGHKSINTILSLRDEEGNLV